MENGRGFEDLVIFRIIFFFVESVFLFTIFQCFLLLGVVFSLEVLFVAFTDFAQTVAIELVFSAEGLVAWLAFVLFKGGVGVFVPFSVVSSEKAQIAD